MVSLQCNNCVIHTWAIQRRASQNVALYKSSFLFSFYSHLNVTVAYVTPAYVLSRLRVDSGGRLRWNEMRGNELRGIGTQPTWQWRDWTASSVRRTVGEEYVWCRHNWRSVRVSVSDQLVVATLQKWWCFDCYRPWSVTAICSTVIHSHCIYSCRTMSEPEHVSGAGAIEISAHCWHQTGPLTAPRPSRPAHRSTVIRDKSAPFSAPAPLTCSRQNA